ncbi:hypothetical protein BSLG_001992 [Batrachochytrium salamandrivorans]|nr:hypothetical protein BSLG_007361 [Batrachochytrium salamandrivorans]KAJ1343402.1 hypothetical protein BSLG_001992 [Batrachochytrium salamandrivorans]
MAKALHPTHFANLSLIAQSTQEASEFAKRIPKENELTPFEKYWVKAKRFKDGFKPIHWVPKWTKAPHPRTWQPTIYHQPLRKKTDS